MAALTLALALLCTLVVVDSGRLYMEKRSLQRVADVAALEANGLNGVCSGGTGLKLADDLARTSATRNGFTVTDSTRTLTTRCGTMAVGANGHRGFIVNASRADAVQVTVSHSVPQSIAAGVMAMFGSGPTNPDATLTATAVAAKELPPLAQLTIASTLADVNAARSPVLNMLWGQLLGGTLNINAVGYRGLTNANINLLNYLDQLAIDLNVKAGDYTSLLGSQIKISQLLDTSVRVLPQVDPAVQAAVNSLKLAVGNTSLTLKDLINLQTGTPAAALNTNLSLFKLVEGVVQAANSQNALAADLGANLGIAGVKAKVKVVQPPRFSAIGDPSKKPTGIIVNTAQVRALLSVDLNGISGTLTNIVKAVPLINALVSVTVLPSIDVSVEVSKAQTEVTGFDCSSDTTKYLDTQTTSGAAIVKIGAIDPVAWSSGNAVVANPASLLNLSLPLVGTSEVKMLINASVGQAAQSDRIPVPNEIGSTPTPGKPFHSLNLLNSLNSSNIAVSPTGPILDALGGLLSGLLSSVVGVVTNLLSTLLDPAIDQLLSLLGVNINTVGIGGNLSCHPGQTHLVI
jgi:uncharacterized membrane protein